MIKNHFVIAVRNLLKQRGYTVINVLGLAVGITCCWLILLYVQDELSFDRFHEDAERIYRVTIHGRLAGNDVIAATSPVPMAETLLAEYPEVSAATRIKQSYNAVLVSKGEVQFNEERVYYVDSTFFDVFTFPLIAGDATTALREPFSIVLTAEMARKYFGQEEPLGKTLTFNNETTYKVTGVAHEVPAQSHFHFDFLVSFNSWDLSGDKTWTSNHLYTYIVLQKDYPPERFAAKLPELVRKYVSPQMEEGLGATYDQFVASGGIYEYLLQPLTEIHLHSHLTSELESNSDVRYVAAFSLIAFFILALACINFMNLATARAAGRAREVGLRKVVGSSRSQLVRQFLLESLVVSAIAFLIAGGLVELLLPTFNALAAKQLQSVLTSDWSLWPALIGATLLVALLAGSYPAFFLASYQPIEMLKSKPGVGRQGHATLRKALVVSQFAVSIALMFGTLVVHEQLQFLRQKELGFDREQVVLLHRAESLGRQLESFENEIKRSPRVLAAAATLHLPGREVWQNGYQVEGNRREDAYILSNLNVGYGFIETLGIHVVAGRSFSREHISDSSAFIINEAAAKKLGWQEPLGRILIIPGGFKGPVIGVVQDFHYESLHREIQPAVLNLSREGVKFLAVRIAPRQAETTLAEIRELWQQYVPQQPFDYSFLDADFDKLYRADQRTGKIVATFAGLGIFVACLGLFGLAAFAAEQRTKEIGVRKVLGASVPSIILLLSREFTKLVLFALLLAAAPAYYFMQQWLQEFAYRVEFNWGLLAFSGALALLIALLTVSTQAVHAALANPVDSLKYE